MPDRGEATRVGSRAPQGQRVRKGWGARGGRARGTELDEALVRLRRELLPESAQRLRTPRYDVAVRYVPAQPAHGVGGDWYDARLRDDGSVLITVGDVSGHGLEAAGRMARISNAMRGLTWSCGTCDLTLTWLNELVCGQEDPETIASAVIGRLDADEPRLSWAQAGHPHPVLVSGGVARLLDRPQGLMLGSTPAARYSEDVLALEPGDLLVFYTDGLVERRGQDIDNGLDALLNAARECPAGTADDYVAGLLDRLGTQPASDDVCVLAVRVLT